MLWEHELQASVFHSSVFEFSKFSQVFQIDRNTESNRNTCSYRNTLVLGKCGSTLSEQLQ